MSTAATSYAAQLGGRIKLARVNAELTQTELACRMGVTRSSIANIEAGRQSVSAEAVVAFSAALECDPHWLLTGLGQQPALPPSVQQRILLDYIEGAVAAAQEALLALRPR